MKNKISNRVESIFSIAVTGKLGRFKSTIFCTKSYLYLLNIDNTTLLRFPLRENERFDRSVCFSSADYDSSCFYKKHGKVIFESTTGGYRKTKTCNTGSELNVTKLFNSLFVSTKNNITIRSSICNVLDTTLSHIEFKIKDFRFALTQRDIYSGNTIRITKDEDGLSLDNTVKVKKFGPVGVRTIDFVGLFALQKSITLGFRKDKQYFTVIGKSSRFPMKGIISHCIYDELGRGGKNGRKE